MSIEKNEGPAEVARLQSVSLEREGRPVLRNIDLEVRRGQHWVLLGPNGSGKSSLLSVLQGWLWPQAGQVSVLGRSFGENDIAEMRKHIGWVGNDVEKEFPAWQTVSEIVESGGVGTIGLQFDMPTARIKREAKANLALVGLLPYAKRSSRFLSQGQSRLLTIARALMAGPELLILDEPCTGLDPVAREQFLQRLGGLLRQDGGPSVFYVTHHIEEILPEMTHALLLREGRVMASGKIGKVLQSGNMHRTFGVKVRVKRLGGRYRLDLAPASGKG